MNTTTAMDKQIKQNRRARSRARASSLVEVLVVLVILLIGVFAVIRVFPLGFTFLQNSESRMRSTQLAHGMIEKVQNEAANLPNAIVYSYFTGAPGSYTRRFVLDEDPDDLSGDPDSSYYKDINKFRYIVGEPAKIGLPTPTTYTAGSIYMPKFGPIFIDSTVGDPTNAPTNDASRKYFNLFLAVNSAPLNVSGGSSQVTPEFYRNRLAGPQSCLVDENQDGNGGAWILFYPSGSERVFTIRYTKLTDNLDDEANSAVAMTEEITVGAGEFVWKQIPGVGANDVILSRSEVVTREFTRLARGTAWDQEDPYQYQLISENMDQASAQSTANPGIIAFNPIGARFGSGQNPFRAYVDYAALDWHIIHDDRDVPAVSAGSNNEIPVRTTLTRIKSLDYINPDNTFYEGIFQSDAINPNANTDILVIRLDTGAILNFGKDVDGDGTPDFNGRPGDYGLLKAGGATQQDLDFWVNTESKTGSYATGLIYINSSLVPPGTPIRILYKASGDWGVALTKAMATYRETASTWPDTWTNVSLDPLDATQDRYTDTSLPDKFWKASAANVGQLYFARTELNKSVVVSFLVRSSATASWQQSQPMQVAIDTPANYGVNNVQVAYADVTKRLKGLGWDGDPDHWRVAGTIKGATAKSRVIWKDSLEKNAPWRIQDLDTYLTQAVLQ